MPNHDPSTGGSSSLPPSDSSADADRTELLLGQCLERSESDWTAAVERICRENPEHADSLRRRYAALRAALGVGDDESTENAPSSPAETVPDAVAAIPDAETGTAADRAIVAALCREQPDIAGVLADALGASDVLHEIDPRRPDPRVGQCIAERYVIEHRLGAGSMGVVYAARDLELGRDVALKFVDANLFSSPDITERFLREAETLAALSHESVVTVFDRGRADDGALFLVMERLLGAPLRDVLAVVEESQAVTNAGPSRPGIRGAAIESIRAAVGVASLPEDDPLRLVVSWCADLAAGLGAAHARGVFHRDVKPSNVFIERATGRPKLLDFGIAARVGDAELTATRSILGTPQYMAPEQAGAVSGSATPALDVYSLASTLYHLVTGRPPYDGGDALAVLAQLQRDDPIPASALCRDLPRDLVAILEVGTERDPARRYATMAELEADLRAFLEHRPVRARPLGRAARAWRRVRRRPARALALAGSIAVGVLLPLTLWLWSSQAEAAVAAERQDLQRRLPALLAFEGLPRHRLLVPLDERAASIAILDRLLELDPDDAASRLWRAALALDQGDHDAAAADLDWLATAEGSERSPYIAAVASRYADANRAMRGTEAVRFENLGVEPLSDRDWFVAGFHELRNVHVAGFQTRALQALTRAARTEVAARDLRLLALTMSGEFAAKSEREAFYREAYEEAARLEGLYGHDTARTCAVRGLALVRLGRYADAIAPLERCLELRPGRHGPWTNLAVAHRRLGDLDAAERCLREAHAVRPHFANTRYTLAQVQRDRGAFDAARAIAREIPDTGWPGAEWMQPHLCADIATQELCAAFARNAPQERLDVLADEALAAFAIAEPHASPRRQARIRDAMAFVRALRGGDRLTAVRRALAQLTRSPQNSIQLANLAGLLGSVDGLQGADLARLGKFVLELARSLDPDNPMLRDGAGAPVPPERVHQKD